MNAMYYYGLLTGLTTLVLVIYGLYLLFNGYGDLFNPGEVLATIDPFFWTSLGQGLAIGFCVIGAAWGMIIAGSALSGASVKAPHVRTKNLLSIIFCEVCGIYGIIIMIVMSGQAGNYITPSGPKFRPNHYHCTIHENGEISIEDCLYTRKVLAISYNIFFSGVIVGLSNLVTGITVGIAGAGCVLADARNKTLFSKLLLITIFGSVMGLFALVISLLLSTKLGAIGE